MFQSTHPRRVWQFVCHIFAGRDKFQSTHPRRVWPRTQVPSGLHRMVSIHTPTQGVTHIIRHLSKCLWFQSTHPRRVWLEVAQGVELFHVFQSTHPRRVWLNHLTTITIAKCFNPHTHAGCDTDKTTNSIHTKVSIHTPTQGVTLYLITYYKSANLIHCYANHHYYSTS